jgi:hypothetical protein
MTLLLDAGALIAVERNSRDVVALIKHERLAGRTPVTHGGIVGQVWRGGEGRQVSLARLLPGVHVVPLGDDLGRRAGVLLRASGTKDVVDAALVALAKDGDTILAADVDDLVRLARASGTHMEILRV